MRVVSSHHSPPSSSGSGTTNGEDKGEHGQQGVQGGRKARDKRLIMSLQVNGLARVSGNEAEWTV
jgi:hypothetical protein